MKPIAANARARRTRIVSDDSLHPVQHALNEDFSLELRVSPSLRQPELVLGLVSELRLAEWVR